MIRARYVAASRPVALPAVVSMSLGIGAATILFSLIKGVLLEPLPYHDADRLVLLRARNVRHGESLPFVSVLDFQDWRRSARSFEEMALYRWRQLDFSGESGTERVQGLQVTPEFFRVLGLAAAVGRLPDATVDGGEAQTIVLGSHLWRRRFGADPDLVGNSIDVYTWLSLPRVGSVTHRVLGVVGEPSRFLPMTSGLDERSVGVDDRVDFWLPLRLEGEVLASRELRGVHGAVGRLAPGITREQAQAELESIAAELEARYPDTNANWSVSVVPLEEAVTGAIRPALWLLLAGVGLLLVISCSNAASLLLARTFERRRELALRSALGASSARLARHVMAEAWTVVMAGGAIGVALAFVGLGRLKAVAPGDLPRVEAVALDGGALLFAVLLAAVTGLIAGVAPASHASSVPLAARLRTGEAEASGGHGLQRMLASLAVAMALVLLIGAGLLQRSVSRLLAVDPGFDRRDVLTLTVSLPEAKYVWRRNTEFLREVIERLSSLPGVDAVGAVRGLPGRETRIETPLRLFGRPGIAVSARPRARIRVVTPTYFRALGIPLLAGRGFEPRDEEGEIGFTRVVLVNETFAERFWPGESALGKRFGILSGELPPMEVIGVVGDVRYQTLDRSPGPEIYYPEALFPQAQTDLVIRTRTPPMELTGGVLAEIRDVEPDVLITHVRTMETVLRNTVAPRRFVALILNVFSATAFVLAVVGVASVMARHVAQRRRELGIRLALGARAPSIVRMVLGRSFWVTGMGVASGLLGAVAGTQFLYGYLYAIEPLDPFTYLSASLVVVTAASLASYVPARRAARTNPLEVLENP